jgi:hypothetical protein
LVEFHGISVKTITRATRSLDRFGGAVLVALRKLRGDPNSRFLRLLGMQISMWVIITLTETPEKGQADRATANRFIAGKSRR